ncbi:MAG TPA: AAA family ATPase [Xanthomonadaceae bacterium]
MKSVIFMDNFRGFKDCIVDFAQVSFLVGENSSGKSSLLAAAHMLLSEGFWVNPDFNSLGHELGTFDELISRVTDSRKEFTLGCVSLNPKNSAKPFAAVMSFQEKNGLPRISRCTFLHEKNVVTFYSHGSNYWWVNHGGTHTEFDESYAPLLENIVFLHRGVKSGAGKILTKKRQSDRYLLLTIAHEISRAIEKNNPSEVDAYWDFLSDDSFVNGTWFAPIRAEPRRIYERPIDVGFSPAGRHTPYLLKNIIQDRSKNNFAKNAMTMLKSFGQRSGLFDDLRVETFGSSSAAPFSLSVKVNGNFFHLDEVGYGVSQVLPIVAEMFATTGSPSYFMQQPEVHLHPKAQAELGTAIYIYAAHIENTLIVVETHSDYLIDRLRSSIREDYLDISSAVDAAIFWCERIDGINHVHKIEIDQNGSLPIDVPESYRKFFLDEALRGLGLDASN